MDKAKAAMTSALGRDGKVDTTVQEEINPATVNEHITRTEHEEDQNLFDRDTHQDHYHLSVQPVEDREIRPEQHSTETEGILHREFNHGDNEAAKRDIAAEANRYHDSRSFNEARRSVSEAPPVTAEQMHHHVHETIQPVVEKEVIEPSVVHKVIPVHDVHHNQPLHHTTSTLPAVSQNDFQKEGGSITGRKERVDAFEGAPRAIDDSTASKRHNHALGGQGARGSTTITEASDGTSVAKDGPVRKAGHSIRAPEAGSSATGGAMESPIHSRTSTPVGGGRVQAA